MKILILYTQAAKNERTTVFDHLHSFKNYITDVDFHYCDILTKMPFYLRWVNYDGIILHYTFLSNKWDPEMWHWIFKRVKTLSKMKCVKVAMPQDEYVYTDELCRFFKEYGIESIFTCAHPVDYQNFYPSDKSGLKHYFTTYPGFVDENTLQYIEKNNRHAKERTIDIGYRARNLPFWLGKFSQIKKEIADVFLQYRDKTSLKMDISTKEQDVFYGKEWLKFIMNCRTMLGCLGGASLLDPKGKIREKVEEYVQKNRDAPFDEVEKACFKGQDYKIQLFTLSPRHFECAMARTCQVLLEGDYHGIMKPGVHFLEIKKDYSNLAQVLKKIEDKKFCKQLAENAYNDLIKSENYTYKKFAKSVVDHIKELSTANTDNTFNNFKFRLIAPLLRFRIPLEKLRLFFFLPHPLYRIAVVILPKRVIDKLRPIKRYFFGQSS